MKCQKCQAENSGERKFCHECGSKLLLVCPQCGAENLPSDKFCGECGHDIEKPKEAPPIDYDQPKSYTPKFLADKILTTRSAIEGERKLVTVLFADVANYTSIAEKLDPEVVHEIMDGCFRIMIDEIHKYEGTINQFTGDGVMALFGAPVAHEDHVQRACYAALAIHRSMAGFTERLRDERDIDFRLRIGLSTGPVVVGSIGDDLRMDYTALGDTTNLAARMQQIADPGTILITDSIHKVIRDHFISESLGELQVRGKKRPVLTYLLKGARGIKTRMDIAAEKGLSPLSGRSEELRSLHRLWDAAKNGKGQVVFIVGEAGIGKSRLVFELHRSLSAENITWLEGHCVAYGVHMPFLPLIDLLKRNFRIDEGDSDKSIIQKIEEGLARLGEEAKERAPYLKFLFSVDPGHALIPAMDAQGRRRMIFDSIRLMMISGSKMRPLVLLLEDLHFIDRDSEEFLKYLIDSLAALPAMLILTYRPGYVNPFGERTFYNHISLRALEAGESLDLAKGILRVGKLSEHVKSLILERAEGNPFFIEEITKSLEEMAALKGAEATEEAKDLDQIQIPMSIQDIIMARVDRLGEEQKYALQFASGIGREFHARLLERIAGIEERATDILDELVSFELIYKTQLYPELTCMFKHSLTQEVVYTSILTSKRKAIHAEIGEAVEELFSARLAEYYEILAHHYERGELWDKAIQYLMLSGEKALGNMANPSANAFFQKALDISNRQSLALLPDQEYAIYHGKGLSEFNIGRIHDAEKDFFQARDVSKGMGDQNKEAESLSMAGWSLAIGKKYEEAIKVYHEAIDFGRKINNPIIEGRNLCGLGLITEALGDVLKAREYIEKAVEIGKKTNSPLILTLSFSLRAFRSYHSGIYDEESIEYLNKMIPMLKSVQNARACMFIYGISALLQAQKGKYTESLANIKEGFIFAEETGEAFNKAKLLNFPGWIYSDLGWISEAKKFNEQSYKAALEIGSGSEEAEANAIVNLAENAFMEGDYAQAEKYLEDLSQKAETDPGYLINRHRWEVRSLCTLGEISLFKGEADEALKCAQKAFEIAEKTLNKRGMIRASRLMGELYLHRKEFSKAEEKLNEALAKAKEVGNPPHLWKTYSSLGKLKEAQGLNWEAKKQYKEALRIIEDVSSNLADENIRNIFLHSDPIKRIRKGLERLQ